MMTLLVIQRVALAGRPAAARLGGPAWNGAADGHARTLEVITVDGMEAAAARLREGGIDAVLLDHADVPCIQWMRNQDPGLPILVLAGDEGCETACRAIDAGAEDVLLPAQITRAELGRRMTLAIARKAAERQQLRHAREDQITGLANALLLEERFDRALARSDRFATLVGLVAIDIDEIADLIGRYGQKTADRLFQAIGERLLSGTRETDTLARTRAFGLTWLVEGLAAIDDIKALVNRLPGELTQPFSIDGQDIRVTASIGVAIAPFHGRDFQTVHGMAEAAMLDVATINGDALLILPIHPPAGPMRSATLT